MENSSKIGAKPTVSDQNLDGSLLKMITVNSDQAKFYDSISNEDEKQEQTGYAKHKRANLLTRVWASLRYKQQEAFTASGLETKKNQFHQHWINEKSKGNFLELGCFRGTRSSWPLIEAGDSYLGIDLSAHAVEALNKKIADANLNHKAKAISGDFLLMDEDTKYELIFAHGVLHHFEDPKPLFEKINKMLKPGGILLLTEPSEVNWIYSLIRKVYRPFQSDSAWEWPFTRNTITALEKYLEPINGFGWGRLSLPVSVFNGIPLISRLSRPLYIKLLKSEVNAGWTKNVWSNSTVTAAYKKK